MPVGPPHDPDRFEDFEECVAALSDDPDLSEEDAERICGAWEHETNAMTTTPSEPEYRQHYQPSPSDISIRELDDSSEEGLMVLRMPIASTGTVRNEGDEPLTREEINGMARQINERDVGVFLSHGQSFEITDARYGQTERLGTWRDAEAMGADERADGDDTDLLVAEAVMPDPETLPRATGRYQEALAILKEQAKRDIPLSASIGWREDEDSPGGNDLMEASIVGIPADPRTFAQEAAVGVMARAAIDSGADPETFVEQVRQAVLDPGDREPDADSMTETDDTEPDAEQAEGSDDTDEQTERQEAPEWAERLLENQESMIDGLNTIAEAVRADDDDDEEDEEDEESAADDPGEEQSPDDEDERGIREMQEALDTLRDGGIDVTDVDLPDAEADADDEAEPEPEPVGGSRYNKYGLKPN